MEPILKPKTPEKNSKTPKTSKIRIFQVWGSLRLPGQCHLIFKNPLYIEFGISGVDGRSGGEVPGSLLSF